MQTNLEKFRELLKKEIVTYPDHHENVDFKDIQSILSRPELSLPSLFYLTELSKSLGDFTKLAAFDSRGFLFGMPLALAFKIPFIMVRKIGRLPGEVISQDFEKEYGMDTLEVQKISFLPGDKVVLHDDLLATGGTAEALIKILVSLGIEIVGAVFLMELSSIPGKEPGRNILKKYIPEEKIISLVTF